MKQTKLFRNKPKQTNFLKNTKICSLSNCFSWSSVCFSSIETPKLAVSDSAETSFGSYFPCFESKLVSKDTLLSISWQKTISPWNSELVWQKKVLEFFPNIFSIQNILQGKVISTMNGMIKGGEGERWCIRLLGKNRRIKGMTYSGIILQSLMSRLLSQTTLFKTYSLASHTDILPVLFCQFNYLKNCITFVSTFIGKKEWVHAVEIMKFKIKIGK